MRKETPESLEQRGLYDRRYEHDACGVGFVCDIKGRKTNTLVKQGLEVLNRLAHRGATGADPKTGDGAGILIQLPHEFFLKAASGARISLPEAGSYGTGLVFLPQKAKERAFCKEVFAKAIRQEGQALLGWRKVPVDDSDIGKTARHTQPVIEQVFVGKDPRTMEQLDFERRLFVIRKKIENSVRASALSQKKFFYITNISSLTFSYKGLLMPYQVERFFSDLRDPLVESALCLVHSRYSTNTFPSWDLSQPFRFLAHNGEINTLRGNINWMHAREKLLKSPLFGRALKDVLPVVVPGGSDSAAIDNVFEFLTLSGRDLAHVMLMLIPSAWEENPLLDKKLRDFYRYHACLTESWDGPAAIAFTDGTRVGAVLDRNGLRPARYVVTKNDLVVMASEVGVLDIPAKDIRFSGRLEPGKIFFIDTKEGRIVDDAEIKQSMSSHGPYSDWLKKEMVLLEDIPRARETSRRAKPQDPQSLLKAFGYTREDLKVIIKPMAENAQEPIGSMGNDTPLALLSQRPQLPYAYFKQLFAQVTNPAIDPIREELVMSLATYLGPEKNMLAESPLHCRKLRVKAPVLSDEELETIRRLRTKGFKTKTVSMLFDAGDKKDFLRAIERICKETASAIAAGFSFVILTDRGVGKKRAALPALIAAGAVHQYLVGRSLRTQIGIILETAEPREVHHFALLLGFGADCINPYGAFTAVRSLLTQKMLAMEEAVALKNYIKAVDKGILKILSKMGISTLQSYRGAQIFEVLGLDQEVVERCFTGTVSRIGGAGFAMLAEETLLRHAEAFPVRGSQPVTGLSSGGLYQWKRDGEFHLWNPETIACLQDAVWQQDYRKFIKFSEMINNQAQQPTTLRSLLAFSRNTRPVSIDEVESVEKIVKRFATGAMSFGSISKEAHETIAIAMNRLGGRSNSGEGGEDPARFIPLANGDSRRSAVKQVASGRFGVTANYLVNADELQIKIAQGAKPGEGGQLPGHKVSAIIAKTRYTTPGVTLISPPPHHDIYSIEDLAQLIFDLKNVNPRARVSVKLVSEIGVGTIAAGVAKGHADMILISGGDGGTGASPLSSIKHAGLPWELGISEAHQTLVLNDLRSRVRLQTDGQMRTGRDVAIAAILGAEEFGFCSAVLITLGCVMLRHCHLNNCSLGIATQEEALCHRFRGRPEYIVTYFTFVARELREIMANLGVRTLDELIGNTGLLEVNRAMAPWKAGEIDFSRILYKPKLSPEVGVFFRTKQDHGLDKVLDHELIRRASPALQEQKAVPLELPIRNTDRAAGAMLSGALCSLRGEEGLPADTIRVKFKGTAGQSFGAFLAKGITFELEGMANDYVGKGVSGGKVIVYPDKDVTYRPQDNVIIGNTAFYGASSGEAYVCGVAGERFCIRNSGLYAVVEGLGDHGCEYMTGGRVVVLGKTGRNFAAGMSGGIAYVYAKDFDFKSRCNRDMVALERLAPEDAAVIQQLLFDHLRYTQSAVAKALLDDFGSARAHFIKVIPLEYKRILEAVQVTTKADLSEVSDG